MQKIRILLLVFLMGSVASPGWAGEYTVTTATALQNALTLAQSNGENDTITVEPGTYNVSTTLTYTSTENRTLTLQGGDGGTATLDGGGAVQILRIDTSGAANDANANIQVLYITFQEGNSTLAEGGGLSVKTTAAPILVEGCVFMENTSAWMRGGGGAFLESDNADVHVANSHFTDNASTQSGSGGGVYAASSLGEVIFVNNIFSGNSSGNGGGVRASTSSGSVNLIHNTFTDNMAVTDGGGAWVSMGDGGGAYLYNNIIWDNTAGSGGEDIYVEDAGDRDGIGGVAEVYHNDYSDFDINVDDNDTDVIVVGNITEDPLLNAEFKLQKASPCIDTGQNTMPHPPDFDFEGDQRNIDGDLDGEDVVDMGADEYKPVMALPAGQEAFNYLPVEAPFFIDTEASRAKPFSVGNISGGTLDLAIRFPYFPAPVDIYIVFFFPALDPNNIYLLTQGNVFQVLETSLVPYISNSEGNIDQSLFGAIALSTADLPPGTYHIYLAVTPAGDLTTYYLWTTYFVLS
ncbi:MAG: hypothetical protein GY864_12585 [Desulfobacterales bacterium]|nr:hypothetical protein [Desulfobacterales bacterium]